MGVETYYVAKTKIDGFGSMFLLNQLQKADSSGGGNALLGTVVQENSSPFHTDYPVPLLVSEANILVKKLTQWKEELNIHDDIIVEQPIAAGSQNIKIEKDKSFQLGLGPFPGIPFNGKFQLDYKKTVSINISYGDGTFYRYLRKNDLMKLYKKLGGQPDDDMTGKFLKKNAFINLLQLAKNWSVSFESTKSFDSDIEAKIALFNNDNAIGGSVKITKKTENKLEATIQGDTYYLVGLMSTRWDDVKPD